ncbi:MAG: SagB family peptide dehydrogenase, partial [Deltaproteobacteria bacterium]|nr:SagB family peptide dehydrogenase [Deltaproteobacteria bacterium]
MKNRDLEAAWAYHNGTKHFYQSIRTNPHYLDWENQPIPFKIYSTLQPTPLPQHLSPSGMAALEAISVRSAQDGSHHVPNSESLAQILYLSAGITKRRSYPGGGEILFRAAACTGALYHIDLYLICGDLPGLEAGVYHFGPHDFALRRLRAGDYRGNLVRTSGSEPAIISAPAIIICASTFWRNAWKYQARAYRHCYWDNGTILANLFAAAAAAKVPARLVLGFVDDAVNGLLGLDPEREGALSLVALGDIAAMTPEPALEVEPLTFETVPLSKREIDYPAIRAMHAASSLESEEEVVAWRGQPPLRLHPSSLNPSEGRLFPLRPLSDHEDSGDTIEEVILRRGSTRQFSHEAITFSQFSTMLHRATGGIPADFLAAGAPPLNDLYLIVHAVDDLPAGAYVFHRDSLALELLKEGQFRQQAGYLGLGQEIPADASVDVFFLSDLHPILE